MEELNMKQLNKEVKELEKNFSKMLVINKQAMEEIDQLKKEVELLVGISKETLVLTKDKMFLSTNTTFPDVAMGVSELAKLFSMDEEAIRETCKAKNSPAIQKSDKKNSPWLCFPKDFLKFKQLQAKEQKG